MLSAPNALSSRASVTRSSAAPGGMPKGSARPASRSRARTASRAKDRPLPLPFSNSLPAWTVLFLAAGALGRDGLFFFAGCASFALSVAFFAFVAFGGMAAFDNLWRLVVGGS